MTQAITNSKAIALLTKYFDDRFQKRVLAKMLATAVWQLCQADDFMQGLMSFDKRTEFNEAFQRTVYEMRELVRGLLAQDGPNPPTANEPPAPVYTIFPPEGTEFGVCQGCGNPVVKLTDDDTHCIMCLFCRQ